METNKCIKCNVVKALSEFKKDKSKQSGYRNGCKECYRKVYHETSKQDDSRKEKQKEYYIKNKEKILEASKKYREDNLEQIKEREKEYKRNNKEKYQEYSNNYAKDNKEVISKKQSRYIICSCNFEHVEKDKSEEPFFCMAYSSWIRHKKKNPATCTSYKESTFVKTPTL